MDAVSLTLARLAVEEGFRAQAYRDTAGHLTIGYGFNIDAGISQGLATVILQYQLADVLAQLKRFAWFEALDPVRASVILDVAFNAGIAGLLHFPRMISALTAQEWSIARDELLDSDAARALPDRYGPLAQLLLNGG